MFPSSLIHAVKSRLAVKLVLMFVLFGAVSILLTMGFMVYQRSLLTGEILKRAQDQVKYLAHNCKYQLYGYDSNTLSSMVSGIKTASGLDAFLVDTRGLILAKTDTTHTDSTIVLPPESYSKEMYQWRTSGSSPMIRTIAPIEINAPIIETDSLLYVHDGDYTAIPNELFHPRTLRYIFPNFAPDSKHILCSFNQLSGPYRLLMSVSIADSSQRILVSGGVSNGFWGHTGKYLVYCHSVPQDNPELCVYDVESGLVRVVTSEGTAGHPNSGFTPDDQYILTGLVVSREKIFRIPVTGGIPEQVTFHYGGHWYPNCSPDGSWILYTCLPDNQMYVYQTKAKSSRRVFPGLSDRHRSGSFSPDGKQICYLRETGDSSPESWDIFISEFPVDESKPANERYGTRLTFTGGDKFLYTDWSPDGNWITYSQNDNIQRRLDICIVSPRTGEIRNLTTSGPSYKKTIGYAVLDIPTDTLYGAVATGNRIALAVGLIFMLTGAVGAFLLVRGIVRPVRDIAEAASDVSRGNLDHQVETSRTDEIGDLARAFNRMTGQLKISLDAVKAGYRELETLNEAKDNFISLVSHEIRTPLSSILVYAEMLRNGMVQSNETAYKYHSTIVDECRRLTRLINDVLDLSKMEAGRLTFHLEALDMGDLVREVQAHFQPLLDSGELCFIDEGGPDAMPLRGDRDRIIQVLTNIVSNAIKFTPSGGTIRVSWKRDNGKGIVAVSDTGKGIAEEDIPRVFDRFSQLENINHHTEGTGLGMAISKSIIECCNGAIWIESIPGKGTTVFFSLPLVRVESVPSQPVDSEAAEDKSGIRAAESGSPAVLIVDDEEPIRTALSECVKSAGLIPFTACDGMEALRLARLHTPAVVVLDVMMPELSGLEVCRKLREAPETQNAGIIMLSARGQAKERREGLRAGADRYITKPFSYEEVMRTVQEFVGIKNGPA